MEKHDLISARTDKIIPDGMKVASDILDKQELYYILASQFAVPSLQIGERIHSPRLVSDGARHLERHLQNEFSNHYGISPCPFTSYLDIEMNSEYSFAKDILSNLNDKRLSCQDASDYAALTEQEFKEIFAEHILVNEDGFIEQGLLYVPRKADALYNASISGDDYRGL
ncbi:MAG: hypothetical protein ACOCU6_01805 [Nanoarchaeota archaeon]